LDDKRTDPFWEFGAFGATGCHRKNLLRRNGSLGDGARLLFIQGGKSELRAVGLTPPIKVVERQGALHTRWDSDYRPIPFESAPILIDNDSRTDFPGMLRFIHGVARSTPCAQAASRLRSRTEPLPAEFAEEVIAVFDGEAHPTIQHYMDAITAKNSPWHRNATKRGWGDAEGREEQLVQLLGEHRVATPVETCRRAPVKRRC
jgi:hypothetical protein